MPGPARSGCGSAGMPLFMIGGSSQWIALRTPPDHGHARRMATEGPLMRPAGNSSLQTSARVGWMSPLGIEGWYLRDVQPGVGALAAQAAGPGGWRDGMCVWDSHAEHDPPPVTHAT